MHPILGRAALAAPEGLGTIYVASSELPAAPEGQYYWADLVGFTVLNLAGVTLGRLDHFVEAAVRRVLRRPSLPKHLPVDTLVRIPQTPGVYLFLGLNEQPLYIGKAKNLRERVGAHFSGDWGSERGTRLSEELRRIEWIETAGDLSVPGNGSR